MLLAIGARNGWVFEPIKGAEAMESGEGHDAYRHLLQQDGLQDDGGELESADGGAPDQGRHFSSALADTHGC